MNRTVFSMSDSFVLNYIRKSNKRPCVCSQRKRTADHKDNYMFLERIEGEMLEKMSFCHLRRFFSILIIQMCPF